MDCVLSLVDDGVLLEAAVATISGRVLGRASDPGVTNAGHIDEERFRDRIAGVITRSLGSADNPISLSVCACLDAPESMSERALADLVPVNPQRLRLTSYGQMAAAGAAQTPRPTNLVVVRAGVSSSGWGVAGAERMLTVGGHGPLLGDEGSAYWIALAAARLSLKCLEKRSRASTLTHRFEKFLAAHVPDALSLEDHRAPHLDRYTLASFAAEVFDSAAEDDESACEILEAAGSELASIAISLVSRLPLIDEAFDLLATGSVFELKGRTLETFMKQIRNKTMRATFVRDGLGALGGGLLLALDHLGLKHDPDVAGALGDSLRS